MRPAWFQRKAVTLDATVVKFGGGIFALHKFGARQLTSQYSLPKNVCIYAVRGACVMHVAFYYWMACRRGGGMVRCVVLRHGIIFTDNIVTQTLVSPTDSTHQTRPGETTADTRKL